VIPSNPKKAPEQVHKNCSGDRFKVTLDIEGKKVHIAYCKTLEAAEEALEQAKRESGVYD